MWTIFICLWACFCCCCCFFFNLCYSDCWWKCWAEAHAEVFLKKTKNNTVNFQNLWIIRGDASLITIIVKIGNLKTWGNGISLNEGYYYLTLVTLLPYSIGKYLYTVYIILFVFFISIWWWSIQCGRHHCLRQSLETCYTEKLKINFNLK